MPQKETKQSRVFIPIRAPKNYNEELEKIARATGLSKNAVCLEILRKGIALWKTELSLK